VIPFKPSGALRATFPPRFTFLVSRLHVHREKAGGTDSPSLFYWCPGTACTPEHPRTIVYLRLRREHEEHPSERYVAYTASSMT
jgi:hypothetical protein